MKDKAANWSTGSTTDGYLSDHSVEAEDGKRGSDLGGDGLAGAPGYTSVGSRFQETREKLSSSRQKLLRRILDESSETFFLSSREMAWRENVNAATIIRAVQALGYEKFADFANDLREHFVTRISPYSTMKAAEETNRSVADRVRQSVERDLANLNE